MTKIGIVQDGPVYYDLAQSMEKMLELLAQANKEKIDILAFGESWLSGYPAWMDHYPGCNLWDHKPTQELWNLHFQSAITKDGPEIDKIRKAAKDYGLHLILGANEKIIKGKGNGSVFNSIFFIDDEGQVTNHHRKLIPTFTEKLLYAHGDAAGLKTVESKHGQLGALICWEHWMPMARQVLHDGMEDIHFALWPMLVDRHQLASKHYAFEGRCFVVAIGQMLEFGEIPPVMDIPSAHKPSDQLLKGGSCIIGPDGTWLMPPDFTTRGIISFTLPDKSELIKQRMTLATSGHYQRRDLFHYNVTRDRMDNGES